MIAQELLRKSVRKGLAPTRCAQVNDHFSTMVVNMIEQKTTYYDTPGISPSTKDGAIAAII